MKLIHFPSWLFSAASSLTTTSTVGASRLWIWRAQSEALSCGYRIVRSGAILLALLIAPAFATTFDYSYTFTTMWDGTAAPNYVFINRGPFTISGSFDGDQAGDYVTNISNLTMVMNGVQVAGPIQAVTYNPQAGTLPGAVVSFTASNNNFTFTDGNVFTNSPPINEVFSLGFYGYSYASPGVFARSNIQDVTTFYVQAINGTWSLTERSESAVPDQASTGILVGAAVTGIWVARRRKRS